MHIKKQQAKFLNETIDVWEQQNLVTEEQATKLKQSIVIRKFDWKQVTIYAFILAVACAILSIIVLLADKIILRIIERFTQLTDLSISCLLTFLATLLFFYSKKRFQEKKDMPISNNSLLLLSAFLSLAAISFWVKCFHVHQNYYTFTYFIATILYVVIAIYFQSATVWTLGFIMSCLAFGSFTYSLENKDQYFLGMNLLLRFIPFSVIMFSILRLLKQKENLVAFKKIHYILSLVLFFLAMWLLTIFGNYSKYENWQQVGQFQFVLWSILLFIITVVGMYFGVKKNDLILGNISLLFFIINLITRYFEYFWEPLHKSIFFMILALIFWYIGSRAEKLWNLKFLEEK